MDREFPSGEELSITPTLDYPPDGVKIDREKASLTCGQHRNPAWDYHFQVAETQDFASHVSVIDSLGPGEYFWRMRGVKTGREPSEWSETQSFEIV